MRGRRRTAVRKELPLIGWLVLVWMALWRDASPGTIVFGALIAVGVTRVFYLPPVKLGGRFNLWYALVYAADFLSRMTLASFEVLYLAVFRGGRLKNAVIAVRLRTTSDLVMTAVGHTTSLIPGSLVVEVDRSTSTLYLHVLNIADAAAAQRFRAAVLRTEAEVIRAIGSREEMALLRSEADDGPTNDDGPTDDDGAPGSGPPARRPR